MKKLMMILVCALGLGPYLVGRTGFCIHPAGELADVPKLGGTKTPMLERLRHGPHARQGVVRALVLPTLPQG